jgi:type IVB pilus formation R64 PilN family outer membrane protein
MSIVFAALLFLFGAPQLQQQQQLPAIQLEQQPQARGLDTVFSINFRDASLVAALNTLAQYAGLNLVIDPSISGTITQDLNNVILVQALDAILPPRGLQYRLTNGILRIEKVQMESRTFKFDYITTSRRLSRSINASATAAGANGTAGTGFSGTTGTTGATTTVGGGNSGGSSASLSGSETANLESDVEAALIKLKSNDGNVIYNKIAGVIFVTDYPRYLDQIAFFLETIQNAVNKQVVIESQILEVSLNNTSQFSVNYSLAIGNALKITQPFASAGGFQITGTYKNSTAVISALSTLGKVKILSSPTIATLNNQPAIMRVATQDVFFNTITQVDPRTGIIVQTSIIPAEVDEGIVLDITPNISDDGIITANVHPTITERTGQALSPNGSTVPIVDVRETDTVVRIREGETIFIGGLIADRTIENVNKVPVLSNLPLVGNLFKSTSKEVTKTDLVILLTPRVLDLQNAVDYTKSRIESQERFKAENYK